MSPIEIEVLKTKLAVITENRKALEPIRSMGLEAYEMELAHNLAPSAGLRNRLVHAYDRLDQAIIRQAVDRAAAYYPLYVQEVYSRLTALTRQEI